MGFDEGPVDLTLYSMYGLSKLNCVSNACKFELIVKTREALNAVTV